MRRPLLPGIPVDLIGGAQMPRAPLLAARNPRGDVVVDHEVASGPGGEKVYERLHLLRGVHVPAHAAAVPVFEVHREISP